MGRGFKGRDGWTLTLSFFSAVVHDASCMLLLRSRMVLRSRSSSSCVVLKRLRPAGSNRRQRLSVDSYWERPGEATATELRTAAKQQQAASCSKQQPAAAAAKQQQSAADGWQ